jgi:hypothetical protein
MPLVRFEPTFSAGERPQTYALDRAATGTGSFANTDVNLKSKTPNLINKDVSKSKTRTCVDIMQKNLSKY